MSDQNPAVKVAQQTEVGLQPQDRQTLLPPKTGSFLPDGLALKIFPSIKDFPADNPQRALESVAKPLKITRSRADVTAGYAMLKRLELIKSMLEGAEDLAGLRQRVKERKEKVYETFRKNMTTIFVKQRGLEKTFRELETFYYEAGLAPGEEVSYVKIVNADADRHFQELFDSEKGLPVLLPNKENFDMTNLEGMIVIPGWVGSEAKLLKYGELAELTMSHLFTGFPDVTLEEAHELFDVGGDFSELKSSDAVKQHISIAANQLRIRRNNAYEKDVGDLYISPTGILVGKIYKGDVKEGIHIAQANKAHAVKIPTPDGSQPETKWDIRGGQQMKFNKAVIPLAYNQGIVFWGVDTLYKAIGEGDEGLDQYTVKRCDKYIEKVVTHFLNSQVFVPNERKSRDLIRSQLSKFLMKNTGGPSKMLEFGKVEIVDVGQNPDGSANNQELDIVINVKYKNAVRKLNLYLISDDTENWKSAIREQ